MKIIDYNKIYANVKKIKENKNLMIVLKDDAYNFDLKKVCVICLSLGIKDFAVRSIEEAIKVRSLSKEVNILLLGKFPQSLQLIKEHNILVTVNTSEEKEICVENNINYHIEIKTSMNRFGINGEELPKFLSDNVKGIYIHTPTPCEDKNYEMLKEFKELINQYNLSNLMVHIGGSSFLKIESSYTYRIACDIYKDSISASANVLYIRNIKANESVGYVNNEKLENESLIAICDVGYVNGLYRKNIDNYVYINQKKYYFIGYKCMDQSFILVDKDVKVGDKVEIIGPNINEEEFCNMNNIILHQMYLNLK